MDSYQETFATWNNIAKQYQAKFMHLDLYNSTYDYICNSVSKSNAKLLEIGCGPGNITQYLLSKRPDFDLFGIDIAPNMIALAQANNPTANFAVMDSRAIHQLTTTYDAIIAGFYLPYLSPNEAKALIASSHDLLNDSGLLYLSFVEGDSEKSDFMVGSGGRVYFYYHNLADLTQHLRATKFKEIKVFTIKYYTSETDFDTHIVLTAKK